MPRALDPELDGRPTGEEFGRPRNEGLDMRGLKVSTEIGLLARPLLIQEHPRLVQRVLKKTDGEAVGFIRYDRCEEELELGDRASDAIRKRAVFDKDGD